jgi:DUF4097 and DUF4098 domain-containing protein YvlB
LLIAAVFAQADEWNKSFKLSGTPSLRVNAKDGAVELSSWEQKEIQVRVETTGWKISPDEVRIIDRQTGDQVDIELLIPRWSWGWHNRSIHMYVKVPRESRLDIHTGDGSIRGSDLHGEFRLHSGDGGIDLDGIEGKLNADTGDGHVRVSGRFEQLTVHTGDGNIRADVAKGSKPTSGWSFQTGDGKVELRLPEDLAADLDARTGDGGIDVDLPVLVSGAVRRNQMHGKINGGGPPLEIRTGDGSIRLSRN